MNPLAEHQLNINRRYFFGRMGLGMAGLAGLSHREADGALPGLPHFAPKAKRVIYLFQSGAPSQLDLFDHKPELAKRRGEDLPDSIRKGQRLTGMTATQEKFPLAPSIYKFQKHGRSGLELSELLAHTGKIADELCLIRTLHTHSKSPLRM